MHQIPVEATIKAPNAKYINEFLTLKCSPDLLLLKLFPNAKEITESFAAYNAVKKHFRYLLSNGNVVGVCVGDGSTPRTGATFAFRTKWDILSIDPGLNNKTYNVNKLTLIKGKIENINIKKYLSKIPEHFILICVHSHATLEDSMRPFLRFNVPIHIIAMPCCVKLEIDGIEPDISYKDYGVFSPERTIKIWKNINEKQRNSA